MARSLALYALLVLMVLATASATDSTPPPSPPQHQAFQCCGVHFNVSGNITLAEAVGAYIDRTRHPQVCKSFDAAWDKFFEFKQANPQSNFSDVRLNFYGSRPIIAAQYSAAASETQVLVVLPEDSPCQSSEAAKSIGIIVAYEFDLPPPHHAALSRMPDQIKKAYEEFMTPKAKPMTDASSQNQKSEL